MNVTSLNTAVSAVCPIDGVSVGSATDRSTWRVDYRPEATANQRTAAQNVIATFDIEAPATVDELYDAALLGQRVLKAVIIAINKGTLVTGANKTAAQLKAIIKAEM